MHYHRFAGWANGARLANVGATNMGASSYYLPAFFTGRDTCRAVADDLNARIANARIGGNAVAVNGGQAGFYVEIYAGIGPATAMVGDMQGPWGLDFYPNGVDDDTNASSYAAYDGSGAAWGAADIAAWVWPLWRGLTA